MIFNVKRYARDFIPETDPSSLIYTVNSYSHHVLGGPKTATITLSGAPSEVWNALNWLRCPIEISDKNGSDVWWGFINDVEIAYQSMVYKVSLDTMFNAVRAIYRTPAGRDGKTPFLVDSESVGEYGRKEIQISLDQVTSEEAYAQQLIELARLKKPKLMINKSSEVAGVTATLTCVGWWETLNWRYYEQPDGFEAYTVTGNTKKVQQAFGQLNANAMVAQSFTINTLTSWDIRTISVGLAKVGTPTDNVVLQLRSSSAFDPDEPGDTGNILASWYIRGDLLSESAVDVPFILKPKTPTASGAYPATNGQKYWICVSRVRSDPNPPLGELGHDPGYVYNWDSGQYELNDVNYYTVSVSEQLEYTKGVLLMFNANTLLWSSRAPDADIIFRVMGIKETSEQLEDILSGYKRDKFVVSESYSEPIANQVTQPFGHAPEVRSIGQRIELKQSFNWTMNTITIGLRKHGNPTDKVRVEFYDLDGDEAIVPPLAYSTFAGAALSNTVTFIPFLLNKEVQMIANHRYLITIGRDPWAFDGGNYYSIAMSEDMDYEGYGVFSYFYAPSIFPYYFDRDPIAQVLFKCSGYVYSDVYASDSFFTSLDLPFHTYRYSSVYKTGDNVVLSDILDIMNGGAYDNSTHEEDEAARRILSRVNQDLSLEFYLEPYESEISYYMRSDGKLREPGGGTTITQTCPVGVWISLQSVIPPSVDVSDFIIVNPFFIESAEFTPESQELAIETKDAIDPYDIGGVVQG